MNEPEPHHDADPSPARDPEPQPSADPAKDEGPGWMPAILAGGLLILMAFFICCGVSTAYLWTQRGELAVRTLRGHTIPMIEQSQLPPEEKQSINGLLGDVSDQIASGRLENWQVSGIMSRLQLLPLAEWGDLAAVEALIRASDAWSEEEKENVAREFSRLRHAVAIGEATSVDLHDVLEPVRRESPQAASGAEIVANPTERQLGEVVKRARLVSERLQIEDRTFADVSLSTIIRKQIEAGRTEGDR